MVNFGLLTAEIRWRVWGTPANFNGFSRLGSVTARHSSSGRQPNFAALNRGRQLYLAGRPSRWALAHILVSFFYVAGVSTTVKTVQVIDDRKQAFVFGYSTSDTPTQRSKWRVQVAFVDTH